MFQRWLLRTLAALLTASLCGAIITVVADQTILSSRYLENRIAAVNGYDRLSADISSEVTKQAGLAGVPQAATILQGIITPSAMQQRVNSALDGLQAYYQGKGPAPTVNLGDLAAQAKAAGVPIGQDSDLFQPVTLGPQSSSAQHPALNLDGVRTASIVTSIALAAVVGALSWKWRRYTVLPGALIGVGVVMGLVSLVTYFGPGELSSYLKFSSGSYAFAALGSDLVQNIARGLAHRFGLIAMVFLLIGVIGRFAASHLQTRVSEKALLTSARASVTARK